jgi:hypothetical protein
VKSKPGAVRILAGEENFSDNEVLGLEKREQQEAVKGVWIYELSELEGMRKADVTHIKLFISKTVDSARPAYGRGRVDRRRRCIFVATTNEGTLVTDFGLVLPKSRKPPWRERSVPRSALQGSVAEVMRKAPGVMPRIGQGEAAGVAQHVRVHREWKLRRATSALDHSKKPSRGNWRASLGHEHIRALASQRSQGPKLRPMQRVHTLRPALCAIDVKGAGGEVDLRPCRCNQPLHFALCEIFPRS